MVSLVASSPASRSTRSCLFVTSAAVAAGILTLRQGLPRVTVRSQGITRAASMSTFGGGTGVTVPARGTPSAAIIFMHGLGDTAHGWTAAFPMPGLDHVTVILPTAESQSVTINAGMKCPSWFDLRGLGMDATDDEPGILASVARVNRIIDEQVAAGIPVSRIVVAGFSQGGAVALTLGLRSERGLAGIVGMSTWLPMRAKYPASLHNGAKAAPILMCHGTSDQVLHFDFGKASAETVERLGRNITWKAYPGLQHSANEKELADVADFLKSVLPQ